MPRGHGGGGGPVHSVRGLLVTGTFTSHHRAHVNCYLTGLAFHGQASGNTKMLELFACFQLCPYPVRLLSSTGPFLGGIFRVLIFWKNLWIGTTRLVRANRVVNLEPT